MSRDAELGRGSLHPAFLAWATVGAGMLLESWIREGRFYPACTASWAAAFLIATASFVRLHDADDPREHRNGWLVALAIQAAGVLFMIAWWRSLVGGLLLVIVAWQASRLLPLRAALAWASAQTAALAFVTWPREPRGVWAIVTLVCGGLQGFAVLGARLARSERDARLDLARTNSELRETLRLLSDRAGAAERAELARDLHDSLGHHLTAISLALESAGQQSPQPLSGLERAATLVRGLFDEMRRLVGALRSDERPDLGLALAELAAEIERPRVQLGISGDLRRIDPARARTLVRCARELVTNAIRHASAQNLWLELDCADDRVRLAVRDDGRGSAAFGEGFGLRGIRERVAAFGGELRIEPAGPGFSVTIVLPLERVER